MLFQVDFSLGDMVPVTGMLRRASSIIVSLVRLHVEPEGRGTAVNLDLENYGTAFCVANIDHYRSIYLTAHHNIVDLVDAETTNIAVMMPSAWAPFNNVFVKTGSFAIMDEHTDIAAFCLDFRHSIGGPARIPVPLDRWDFEKPQVGDVCVAMGFGGTADLPDGFVPGMHASRGVIEEVHPSKRDSAIVNYPCFLTNAEFPHGMSGGPVFNDESGRVVGVVSRGTTVAEGGVPTSYASLVPTATILDVPILGPRGFERIAHLGNLVRSGKIDIGGESLTRVHWTNDGVEILWD